MSIDVRGHGAAWTLGELITEATASDGETELAYRGGVWLSAQLRQGPQLKKGALPAPRSDAAAALRLITGGLGGLGLRAAAMPAQERRTERLLLASAHPCTAPPAASPTTRQSSASASKSASEQMAGVRADVRL